jgi:hypothetical protein
MGRLLPIQPGRLENPGSVAATWGEAMQDAGATSNTRSDSAAPARRFIAALLGFESAICVVLAFWPELIGDAARTFGMDVHPDPAMVRFFAIGGFIFTSVARIVVRAQGGPSTTEVAWTEFASRTGGTFTTERRRPTSSGWEGGPVIHWGIRGADVSLKGTVQNRNSYLAKFQCSLRLARPVQFVVSPRNLVTRALASPRLWGMLLALTPTTVASGPGAEERRRAMAQMTFLATPEQTIGDPLFDQAFLMKSSDESAAREFFSDAGVGHWLRELNSKTKGWSLSLMAPDSSGWHQLSLDLPGLTGDPDTLEAGRSCMDAAIARLRDRGLVAPEKTAAA